MRLTKCCLVVALLSAICFGDEPAKLSASSAIERFAASDRQRIVDAVKDFVVAKDGTFWDRSVQRQRQAAEIQWAQSKRRDADRRTAAPFGVVPGITAELPLWYDAVGKTQLSEEAAIKKVAFEGGEGCVVTEDRYVASTLLEGGAAIVEHWKDNAQAIAEYQRVCNEIAQAERKGHNVHLSAPLRRPPEYVEAEPFQVVLKGHDFKFDGDKAERLELREVEPYSHFGRTFRAFVECKPEDLRPQTRSVDAEELANAVLTGKARLTEWQTLRRAEPSKEKDEPARIWYVWIAKDATPRPVADPAGTK